MTNTSEATDPRVRFQALGDAALQGRIEIKAAPDRVYAAWTDPKQLAKWFGPASGKGDLRIDHFDCRVGGRYDMTMCFDHGDRVRLVGTYQELDPPKKIVFTWQWMDSPTLSEETRVTIDLARSEVGTHLTLTHERFASPAGRNQHHAGWEPLLVRLASLLATAAD